MSLHRDATQVHGLLLVYSRKDWASYFTCLLRCHHLCVLSTLVSPPRCLCFCCFVFLPSSFLCTPLSAYLPPSLFPSLWLHVWPTSGRPLGGPFLLPLCEFPGLDWSCQLGYRHLYPPSYLASPISVCPSSHPVFYLHKLSCRDSLETLALRTQKVSLFHADYDDGFGEPPCGLQKDIKEWNKSYDLFLSPPPFMFLEVQEKTH